MTTTTHDRRLTTADDAATAHTPSARAMREMKSQTDDYMKAKQALLEQVRISDGYVAGGIVDQVADATSIPAHVVQRALLDLVGRGELVSNDRLAITLPSERA